MGGLTICIWKEKLYELSIWCIDVITPPAWKHNWQLHKSKCWGQVISLPALGHIIYMTAWTKNRQGTVAWKCTRNMRLMQAHTSNRSCFTLRSASTTQITPQGEVAFLPGRGKWAGLGDHYSLQFSSDHSQSWFRAPQHGRLAAVPQVQGRGSCQAVLAREKGRALASWARVSWIYQRQAAWEADIPPSCSGALWRLPCPSFAGENWLPKFQAWTNTAHEHYHFVPADALKSRLSAWELLVWCCWSLSHGSEFSCHTSALHLPSLIVMGVPVQKGRGWWRLSSGLQWHCAAVAAAALPKWEVIWGAGLGLWHSLEGEQKRNTEQYRKGGSESPSLLNRATKQCSPLWEIWGFVKPVFTDNKFYLNILGRTWVQDPVTLTVVISKLRSSASANNISYTGY